MDGPYGTNIAAVTRESAGGIISLRGATSSGTDAIAFTLPSLYRPSSRVYVPVVMFTGSIGRLVIDTDGNARVEGEGGALPSSAVSFTSLDGVSFASSASGTTALTLLNGWTTTPYGTRAPAVRLVNGFVRFQGAMMTSGTNAQPFTLPAGFRPTVAVYASLSLCNGTKGRLNIGPNGNVTVQAEGSFTQAQCFTSLEGAFFPVNESSGASGVALESGWSGFAGGAGDLRFRNDAGIVRFQGAISGGTAVRIMTLPPAYRPATAVYVGTLTSSGRGRVRVSPDGSVSIDPSSQLAAAQGLLSFEGASFGL